MKKVGRKKKKTMTNISNTHALCNQILGKKSKECVKSAAPLVVKEILIWKEEGSLDLEKTDATNLTCNRLPTAVEHLSST